MRVSKRRMSRSYYLLLRKCLALSEGWQIALWASLSLAAVFVLELIVILVVAIFKK